MRILIAHNRYQTPGGEDVATGDEIDLLKRHGHSTLLFEADNAEIDGFCSKVRTALGSFYSTVSKRALADAIASFQPNIVQVHNFFPLLSPSIYSACRKSGIPVIQTLHNYRTVCPGALLLRNGQVCEECLGKQVPWPGVLHACYRQSVAGSAVVATMIAAHRLVGTWDHSVTSYVALTNFSRDKLIQGGLPAAKITVIPSFAPDPGPPRANNGRYALYLGRLSKEKGIAVLLAAWKLLKSVPLTLKIAGDGPLKEEVKRHSDGRRVTYVGALSRELIQELLSEAAFVVFPSICYENFPLAIVEAFAAGVPVVSSGMGAMTEIIKDGCAGLHFRPGDAADLAQKILWMVDHPQEMLAMRGNARTEYLAKYTPERNYALLAEVYRRALGRSLGLQKEWVEQDLATEGDAL